MGYACPVCGAEQADGVHLANHLAVTASLGRTDHEGWLETHAPDWADRGPEALADEIVEYAPEVETPAFDEEGSHEHGRPPNLEAELASQTRGPGRGTLTEEASAVLDEARELTRQMQAGGDESERSEGREKSDVTDPGSDDATDAEPDADENA